MSDKNAFFLKLARPYVARRLRRQFFDVRIGGLDRLQPLVNDGPVILACNHVAWWDPLLLVHLDAVLKSDGYCLMDRVNLNQLPFFRWVGALPLDRTSQTSSYRDLLAAGRILNAERKILAIFPHGDQRPAHLPLNYRAGIVTLAARTLAPVVPLAIRYDFLQSPRQIAHLRVGVPLRFSSGTDTKESFLLELEERTRTALLDIDQQILNPKGDFVSLLHPSTADSTRERIPQVASALRLVLRGKSS